METSDEFVQCPFDPGHKVPLRSLDKHKELCLLKKMDYSSEEQKEIVDTSFCYENSSVRTFVMDEALQHNVISQARSAAPLMKMEESFGKVRGQYSGEPVDVPQNHKRALCDLTVADRLALYDHVISELSNQKDPAPSGSNEDLYVDLVKKLQKGENTRAAERAQTHLELMAEKRDYKRRRQSYRAKNVHITKKSYTEVIRDVINVHSEELSRQWRDDETERRRHSEKKKDYKRNYERDFEKNHERNYERDHHDRDYEKNYERDRHERGQDREKSHERHRDGEHKKKKKKRQR
ncbi:hypothetical protein WMY93_006960 [Mugilogobius chulae]|uniref:CHHC U11-48K-type domain-containing protein n=1 Tax=Mugilogobius chulae TaxID=88201 RepID=A0AAW0PM15_9GOBI